MNITNINNDYMNLIKSFVRNWCDRYCINYDSCLGKAEELLDVVEIKTILGTRVVEGNREYIERAAEVLGTTVEAIVKLDSNKLNTYYEKYAYFRLYPEALKEYNEQFEKQNKDYPLDAKDITKKIVAYSKQYEGFMPGIYHKDATITKLMIEGHIITSFSEAKELWKSYIEMVERVQELFYKALLSNKLTKEEINEYNLLVSALNVTECIMEPSKMLHYSLLEKLIKVYQEEEYKEFYSFARINLGLFSEEKIYPWCFKETISDKNIIQKYINIHPVINGILAKEYLRKYAMKAKCFYCSFEWSDAPGIKTGYEDVIGNLDIRERTEIYLPKEESEISNYADECELLRKFASPPNMGGITMPERELPYQHYYDIKSSQHLERLNNRLGACGGACHE